MNPLNITIRPAKPDELTALYTLVTSNDEWTKFNGPYFPYTHPTLSEFADTKFARLRQGEDMQVIVLNDKPVGTVNCYWECEITRWLEAGIILYDPQSWGQGIGRIAASLWISVLFQRYKIARVGMTTWSGNPRMMALARHIGLTLEGRLRRVRYYQGQYYDSVKFGVLRAEWAARMSAVSELNTGK